MLKKSILAGIALLSLFHRCGGGYQDRLRQQPEDPERGPQAARAKKKIEKDFETRDQELQRIAKQLQSMQENLDKNAVTMAEASAAPRSASSAISTANSSASSASSAKT
jgi:hypothetical protein